MKLLLSMFAYPFIVRAFVVGILVSLCAALNVSPTYLLVEVLPQQGNQDIDALLELLQTATPKQLNMMVSMLRGALEASRE